MPRYFYFLLILFIAETSFAQDYFEKDYPAIGGGISFGGSYFTAGDLNDYVDLLFSSLKKDNINTGINVGLFVSYAPNEHFEIMPEFGYLYSRKSYTNGGVDLAVSYVQLGGTLFYIKPVMKGINMRVGGGVSEYLGNISWEYSYSTPQNWKGSTIGFHGDVGGEMLLNPHFSVSALLTVRWAKIGELKDKNDAIVMKPGEGKNLQLNFSGIAIRILLSYFL